MVFLAVAEVSLRVGPIADAVPQPDLYYQPGVQTRLDALDATTDRYGGIDLLFVGSSVVRTNFQPLAFDDELLARTGHELVSFNGGLSDLFPDPVRLYLDKFWFRHSSPSIVVQGVRYNEVRINLEAMDFQRFQEGRLEPHWLDDTLLGAIQAWTMERSVLFQHAGALTQTLSDLASGTERRTGFAIDERGNTRTNLTLGEARETKPIEDIPGSDAAIAGYDDPIDAANFEFGLRVLSETHRLVASQGAVYVLVNIPEHADKFLKQPDGQERYALYVEQLRSFAESEGILFFDPTNGLASTYADDTPFSDFHHMNPEGARGFSVQFADFVGRHLDEVLGPSS